MNEFMNVCPEIFLPNKIEAIFGGRIGKPVGLNPMPPCYGRHLWVPQTVEAPKPLRVFWHQWLDLGIVQIQVLHLGVNPKMVVRFPNKPMGLFSK